jgi:hypothetical protein
MLFLFSFHPNLYAVIHLEPAETIMVTKGLPIELLMMFRLGMTAVLRVMPFSTNPQSLQLLCNNVSRHSWHTFCVLVDCRRAWRPGSLLSRTTPANCRIYNITSWRWATSKPETCRGMVTEWTEDKQCISLVSLHAHCTWYSVVIHNSYEAYSGPAFG